MLSLAIKQSAIWGFLGIGGFDEIFVKFAEFDEFDDVLAVELAELTKFAVSVELCGLMSNMLLVPLIGDEPDVKPWDEPEVNPSSAELEWRPFRSMWWGGTEKSWFGILVHLDDECKH